MRVGARPGAGRESDPAIRLERASVAEQVVALVAPLAGDGRHEIAIRLAPPELGALAHRGGAGGPPAEPLHPGGAAKEMLEELVNLER